MMNKLLAALRLLPLAALSLFFSGCGIYSFSGTSIQPDVKTITIEYFEYKALKVNPQLATKLTDDMREKFHRLTRLEQVEQDGDLNIYGEVTGYEVSATSITAGETAARNRLTVTIKVTFNNRKYPEDDFDKSFSAYADFDSTQLLDAVQDSLCEEIVEKLIDDVFNASVAQW